MLKITLRTLHTELCLCCDCTDESCCRRLVPCTLFDIICVRTRRAQDMAYCAERGQSLWDGATAETGSSPEQTAAEQAFDALVARWAGALLISEYWTPTQVQRLAAAHDIIVAHRAMRKCCIFRSGRLPQPLGAACAVELMRNRTAVCILMVPYQECGKYCCFCLQ